MSRNFLETLQYAAKCAATGTTAGGALGTSVVSGVCAMGGSVFGPVGTFFGASVGATTGAVVGGAVGCVSGFIGGIVDSL